MGIKDLIVSKTTDQDFFQVHYFDVECSPEVDENGMGKCQIVPKKQVAKLDLFKVKAESGKRKNDELRDNFGIDPEEMLRSALVNEMKMGEDKSLYNKFLELGEQRALETQTKFQKFSLKWFGYRPKFFIKDHEDLIRKIVLESKLIATKTRVRSANFIIVNPQLNAILQDSPMFQFTGPDKQIMGNPTIYQTGIISGSGISVFVNPNLGFKEMKLIIGATTKETEQGVYMAEMEHTIESAELVNMNDIFDPKIVTEVRKKFAIISTEKAKDKFLTIWVTIKKHNLFTHLLEKIKEKLKWKKLKSGSTASVPLL